MELNLFIRYFGVIVVALFLYTRILNIKDLPKSKIAAAIIFALVVPLLLSSRILFSNIIVLVLVCLFLGVIFAKDERRFMLPVAVISVGISLGIDVFGYVILMLVDFIISIIGILVYFFQTGEIIPDEKIENLYFFTIVIPDAVFELLILMISITFIRLLAKVKRLKKGFIFLENKNAMRVGVILSILIVIIHSIIQMIGFLGRTFTPEELDKIIAFGQPYISILVLIFLVFAVVCLIGIHFWWKNHTARLYQQRLNERIIRDRQAEIKDLKESNEFLSAMIHRDNKLIPAMYNALSVYLESAHHDSSTEMKTKGLRILSELEEMMQERKGMLLKNQRESKSLPLTKIERIDTILSYMFSKATENNIEFDFILSGIVNEITESVISKQKLATLLSDLIENAIIATTFSTYKRILVTMGIVEDCLEIHIQDSGIPFEIATLANLGLKQATTHTDAGGSGIGYLTIFEILNESNASFSITEYALESYAFTKSIKVRFDGKSQFAINSFRASEIKAATEREDMLITERGCLTTKNESFCG